jgi:hypothetical protein
VAICGRASDIARRATRLIRHRKAPRLALAALATAGALAGFIALVFAPASGASGPLVANFVKVSDWGTGYTAEYVITNGGTEVDSWTLSFTLSSGQQITNEWNGTLTESDGIYTVTSLDWNSTLASGGTAQVGLQVEYSGSFEPPGNCTLNGAPCAGATTTTIGGPTTTSLVTTTTAAPPPTTTSLAPAPAPVPPPTPIPFAPYVDATVDTPPFDLVADLEATGTKYFTLGFIVSGDGCSASWGGYYPVSSGYYASEIAALRGAGGDVSISFGGEAGTELADTCTTVAALETQYQSVITEYNLTHIDFDIEGTAVTDTLSINRRFDAIAALEEANPGLSVSITLPVLPSGLDANGLAVVQAATHDGARIDFVNLMTMDYGDSIEPKPSGQMGTYAIDAAKASEAQLAKLYPADTSAQLYGMIGITPMLGVNDVTDEIFTVANARQLDTWAAQDGIGRLSMWAATRDGECAGGSSTTSNDTCSGVVQAPWAFSDVLSSYPG